MGQTPSLSEEDRHLITNSYTGLRFKTNEFSAMLFTNIFVSAPQFGRHFNFSSGNSSSRYEQHVEMFITEVSTLVNCLHRECKEIKSLLDKNADVHKDFDVTYEEYQVLQVAFVKTLKMTFRKKFTNDIEDAWNRGLTSAFTYIWERILAIRMNTSAQSISKLKESE